jgi:hypothetical protein
MRLHDIVRTRDNVTIDVVDVLTGRVVHRERGHNLVMNGGLNLLRDFLAGDAVAGATHFALGTGNTAAALADTGLAAEVHRGPVALAVKTAQAVTLRYYISSTQLNGTTIREAGLFNAASLGTLIARYVLGTPISKTSSIAVVFSWDVSWANA